MLLKLFGSVLLVAAGIFAGTSYAGWKRRAIAQVAQLCTALRFIRARIAMLRTPLPDLIAALAREKGLCAPVFEEVCKHLEQGLETAVQQASVRIEDLQARQIFYRLGVVLGRYEADEELRQLDAAVSELETRMAWLHEEYRGKAPLVRRLTAAAGICLAILLI